jgi:signal peptidase I
MEPLTQIKDRKKGLALIAGLIQPGLGQIYNGELGKGLCFFVIFASSIIFGLRLVVSLPGTALLVGIGLVLVAALAFYIGFGIEAWRSAASRGSGFMPKWYNRWYMYAAMVVVCSGFAMSAAFSYTSNNIIQFCRVVTGSMEPAVFPGDYVIVDRTYYRHNPPRKGDIILFRYPDDRSKLYIKRIAGLPGDTINAERGPVTVPHGQVFVLGDNSGHSDDSRHYGPVPLADVLGKARQVYLSLGHAGVRLDRVGVTLP